MPNQTNVNGNLTNEQKAVHFDLLVEELAELRARVAELEAALLEEKRIHPEDFQQGDFRERALAAAIELADEMHLGRCASSEPLTAQEYRNHASEARNILCNALARANPDAPADPFPCRSDPRYKGTDYRAAPAKHADTDRHMLAKALMDALDVMRRPVSALDYDAFTLRNKRAIDVARKHGGSHD